jgi:hypothetical protein
MDVDYRLPVKEGNLEGKVLSPEEALEKRLKASQESRKEFHDRCNKIVSDADKWDMTQMLYSYLSERCITARISWLGGVFLSLSRWCQKMANRKANMELKKKIAEDQEWRARRDQFHKSLQDSMDKGWVETDEFWKAMWQAIQDTRPSVLVPREGETTIQAMRRVIEETMNEYEGVRARDPILVDFEVTGKPSQIPESLCRAGGGAICDRGKVYDPLLEKLKGMQLKELLDKNNLTPEEQAVLADLLQTTGNVVVVKAG